MTENKWTAALASVRRVLVSAASFSFFVNLLMLTGPLYMLQVYDRVLTSRSEETLLVITGLILVLFVALASLDFARGALLARAGSTLENELRGDGFDYAMDVARSGVSNLAPGVQQLSDQPLRDLRQVRQFLGGPGLTAVFDAPWAPLFIAIIFYMHPLLGWVAVAGLIVLLALAALNQFSSQAANSAARARSSQADAVAASAFRNASAADAMGMREALKRKWWSASEAAIDNALVANARIGGFTASTKALRLFLQSAILGTGAYLAIQGLVSPGIMIAASIITGRALAPVEIVTSQWQNFAATGAAYKRLRAFVSNIKEQPPRTNLPKPVGALSVSQLYCRPTGAKDPVVRDVSFTMEAGEVLGIIGPSAAGKSTLARALVGVEPVIGGEIRLDGAQYDQWDRDTLGSYFGFLPQEVELFAGTAADNISRFSAEPDHESIIAAAQAAGAHEMILGFEQGYDTEIGQGGAHLSAGQRQRLALARALYGEPILVVLDEPNSNLDPVGDGALAHAIAGLKARNITTVIVAHRPSAIANADRLLILNEGRVQALGPKDEILQRNTPAKVSPIKRPPDELVVKNSE